MVKEDSNLWKYTAILPGDPTKNRLKYKYSCLHDKRPVGGPEGKGLLDFVSGLLSKSDVHCEESNLRDVSSLTQFDVFEFPGDKQKISDTGVQAVMFYAMFLLPRVNSSNISEILLQIESLNFVVLETKHLKDFVNWIMEQALDSSVSDEQLLYLCIVLGHLLRASSSLPFPNNSKTPLACDCLLECLNNCADLDFLSSQSLERLEKVAITLVKQSSRPSWLALVAHFFPHLGIDFVLDKLKIKDLHREYDVQEYQNMVGKFLMNVKKKYKKSHNAHKFVLDLVLQQAPNLDSVWDIYESDDVDWLFDGNEDAKVDFFVKFYLDKNKENSTQMKAVGTKLVEFYDLPKEIGLKLNNVLYATLYEFAKSDDELDNKDVKIFLRLLLSENNLTKIEIFEILIKLSKSRSALHRDTLIRILDNEFFEEKWCEYKLWEKVEICKSWVINEVVSIQRSTGQLEGVNRIVAVYEAINSVINCCVNIWNKDLVRSVSGEVLDTILRYANPIDTLKASFKIDKCVAVVKEFYRSETKNMISNKNVDRVLKKAKTFIEACSSSRYSVFIHIYPLLKLRDLNR